MLLPASAEFVDLCRMQIAMLVQSLGASLIAIYLTEDPTASSEAALVPLVMYPEESNRRSQPMPLALSGKAVLENPEAEPALEPKQATVQSINVLPPSLPISLSTPDPKTLSPESTDITLLQDFSEPSRIVLPLMHENLIWGVLVAGRDGRRWSKREQGQLKHTAQTLAIACVLDQRSQFLAQRQDQQRQLQGQQYGTFSMLLHQVRNPLTTLRTLGKLLMKRLQVEDANRSLVETILAESQHLDSLLQQFDQAIDLGEASLETDAETETVTAIASPMALLPSGQLVLQPCWLVDVLQPILDAIAGRLEEQHLGLTLSLPPDLPSVQADPSALREIFGNLVDNAVKYTPPGGAIHVSVRQDVDAAQRSIQVVQISDTGAGIPASDLERIFAGHYRGIQAATEIPGTGLGLAIAQQLVTQMGGTLQAISPALEGGCTAHPFADGAGSTFVVTLLEKS
jgi:signal transduction histidine kinase